MKYEYCSNISLIIFWTDIARFLQYFRNLSNSFINILAILQDFYAIFSKYFFNIIVLCGLLSTKLQNSINICDTCFRFGPQNASYNWHFHLVNLCKPRISSCHVILYIKLFVPSDLGKMYKVQHGRAHSVYRIEYQYPALDERTSAWSSQRLYIV